MTTHALERLAVEVHGWEVVRREDGKRTLIRDKTEERRWLYYINTDFGETFPAWSPPTNTTQAVKLLEAWYHADEYRFYDIMRRPDPDRFAVALHSDVLDIGLVAQTRAPTLPLAICRAVCAAMKIYPEAAE